MAQSRIILDTTSKEESQVGNLDNLSAEQKKQVATLTLIGHQVMSNAKQGLNYAINNIGNYTGNYLVQEKIQTAMGAIGDIATIGIGFSAGVVGGVIALASVAVSKSLEVATFFQDQRHKQNEAEYLRERSGNSTINDSRGTEN